MSSKSRSTMVGSAVRKRTEKAPGRRSREAATASDAWEQSTQVPDERVDEIDCQRIVQGNGGRSLPLYYDEYN